MINGRKRFLPLIFVSFLFVISLLIVGRGLIHVIDHFVTFIGEFEVTADNMTNQSLSVMRWWEMPIVSAFLIVTWALGTKVHQFQSIKWRWIFFLNMVAGIIIYYIWLLTSPIYHRLIPYILEHAELLDMNHPMMHEVIMSDIDRIMLILLCVPIVVTGMILMGLGRIYARYPERTKAFFKEWELATPRLKKFFDLQKKERWPDIDLGPDTETNEMVTQKGQDRPLHNLIIGSIGTGKTSALILPILNQDLYHMSFMINQFKTLYPMENYHTEIKQMLLNGISVIEPSKDLCDKTMQLVRARNIPEEAVFYLDPTNPNTPSINPFKNPVDKVAETFTMVIEGLGEKTDFFFEQSQRTHLKHYIYLLKLHDPDNTPTFDDLIDMYNNPQIVAHMHQKLKKQIPDRIEEIEDRDERNHWQIVKGIDAWFDNSLGIETEGVGHGQREVKITDPDSPFYGEPKVYDKKADFVLGLRNILNDIASNKLLRRVLFGHSDFDFDKHLEYGGVLLVNTAKGELSDLSSVLGKFVLLSLQNAVFRRKPNESPFHHILVDEFPDYMYETFTELPAQGRKYKVIVSVAAQTIAQLSKKYGNDYMEELIGTLRHKFVYGDIPNKDAQLFSRIFGEEEVFDEGQMDQEVSPLLENPNRRVGSTFSLREKPVLSPSQLIYQDRFQCAIKIVKDNKPMPVRQIKANFVPEQYFKKADYVVNDENGAYWMEERRKGLEYNDLASELLVEDIEKEDNELQSESIPKNEEELIWPQARIDRPKSEIRYDQATGKLLHGDESPSPESKTLAIETNVAENLKTITDIDVGVKSLDDSSKDQTELNVDDNDDVVDFGYALGEKPNDKEKAESDKAPLNTNKHNHGIGHYGKRKIYQPSSSLDQPRKSSLTSREIEHYNELNMKTGSFDDM